MSHPSAFKSADGETAFLAAYDDAMKAWPVPYDEFEIPSRFGTTYVIASGPRNAPPLVLLHGYMATSTMWAPNVADLSRHHRVYAIDIMGQPGKSIPNEPIRTAADYVMWLNTTLYGLPIDRFALAGVSYGGWVAMNYAIARPERVEELVLLSPGGLLPIATQFRLRGMLMVFFPTRWTVNSMMRWAGFSGVAGEADARRVLEVMYLGMKHFRIQMHVFPTPLTDDQLQTLRMPVLLLMGDNEVLYDAATALDRAQRVMPNVRGTLVPHSSHDMCFTQHAVVDARVVDFLKRAGESREAGAKRFAA